MTSMKNIARQNLPGTVSYPAESVLNELKASLRSGRWKPGEQFPTEMALTKSYGLCRSTVNKILKKLEKEGLLHGGPGKGRFVTEYSKRKTGVVELVLSGEDAIRRSLPVINAMKAALSKAGYHLRITSLNHTWGGHQFGKSEEHLNLINPDQFDGCVILTQAIQLETALALAFRKPVVWFNNPANGPGLSGIRYDFAGGAFMAMRHLLELGHRRIGFVGVHERYVSGREQIMGIKLALKSHGGGDVTFQSALGDDFTEETGHTLTRQILSGRHRPTALLFSLDEHLLGAFKVFKEMKISIPKDLSVVGWNDSIPAGGSPVPLTSLRMDFDLAGRLAVELMIRQIENPGVELPTAEVPAELVVRKSTGRSS